MRTEPWAIGFICTGRKCRTFKIFFFVLKIGTTSVPKSPVLKQIESENCVTLWPVKASLHSLLITNKETNKPLV